MAEANPQQNPETLSRCSWGTNLCFNTHRGTAWQNAFDRHHEGRVTKRIIQGGLQLCIQDLEDPRKIHLRVNFFHTGKVVVQGERPVLTTFENETFNLLQKIVLHEGAALPI